jgi:hypothetical protein
LFGRIGVYEIVPARNGSSSTRYVCKNKSFVPESVKIGKDLKCGF